MISRPDSGAVGQPQLGLTRDILASILAVTIAAWKRVQDGGRLTITSRETEIAGELASEMILEKERRGLPFRVEEEIGTRSPVARKPDGRIDVKIIYNFQERDYLGIECKRIRASRSRLVEKYVKEGVMRFVAAKYGQGHAWGALVGFAIDGDCTAAASVVGHYLTSKPDVTHLQSTWQAENSLGSIPNLHRTHHRQQHPNNFIVLLHLFLPL